MIVCASAATGNVVLRHLLLLQVISHTVLRLCIKHQRECFLDYNNIIPAEKTFVVTRSNLALTVRRCEIGADIRNLVYVQINEWNLPTLVNVAKLNVHCINVRSVKNKAISVSDLVISRDIDILALTETWLGSAIDGHVISTLVPCGYEFHSVSRPHGTRGGVAVLYKSGLTVKPIPMRDNYTNFEHSDYYVTIRAVTFRLCVVYRPPPCIEAKRFF